VTDAERQTLNRKLAEKMGWKFTAASQGVQEYWDFPDGSRRHHIPDFTRDDNAMREVRQEISKRGPNAESLFANKVYDLLKFPVDRSIHFILIDWPTEIQAQAAVEVL